VPALAVSTEEDDFVLHAPFTLLVEMSHVLLEAAPLLFRVLVVTLGFCIRILILPIDETEVLLFLVIDLALSALIRVTRQKEKQAYKVKRLVIGICFRLQEESFDNRVVEVERLAR
jgi:hypothetical protein